MVAWNNEEVCAFYCIIIELVLGKYNLFSYMFCPNTGMKFREPYHSNHVISRLVIRGYKIARLSSHSLIRYRMSNMASDAKAWFSSKVEYGAVIRSFYLKVKTGKEIYGELTNIYVSSAPSYV